VVRRRASWRNDIHPMRARTAAFSSSPAQRSPGSSANAADSVWDLCGLSIVAVAPQSLRLRGDPAFELSDGRWLEIFSDQAVDPWSMQLPGLVFVGSPSDPSQAG
jgi:hypothetical protein